MRSDRALSILPRLHCGSGQRHRRRDVGGPLRSSGHASPQTSLASPLSPLCPLYLRSGSGTKHPGSIRDHTRVRCRHLRPSWMNERAVHLHRNVDNDIARQRKRGLENSKVPAGRLLGRSSPGTESATSCCQDLLALRKTRRACLAAPPDQRLTAPMDPTEAARCLPAFQAMRRWSAAPSLPGCSSNSAIARVRRRQWHRMRREVVPRPS